MSRNKQPFSLLVLIVLLIVGKKSFCQDFLIIQESPEQSLAIKTEKTTEYLSLNNQNWGSIWIIPMLPREKIHTQILTHFSQHTVITARPETPSIHHGMIIKGANNTLYKAWILECDIPPEQETENIPKIIEQLVIHILLNPPDTPFSSSIDVNSIYQASTQTPMRKNLTVTLSGHMARNYVLCANVSGVFVITPALSSPHKPSHLTPRNRARLPSLNGRSSASSPQIMTRPKSHDQLSHDMQGLSLNSSHSTGTLRATEQRHLEQYAEAVDQTCFNADTLFKLNFSPVHFFPRYNRHGHYISSDGLLKHENSYLLPEQIRQQGLQEIHDLEHFYLVKNLHKNTLYSLDQIAPYDKSPSCPHTVIKTYSPDDLGTYFWSREASCLRDLDHPNIVQLMGYATTPNSLDLVLEFVSDITLYALINGRPIPIDERASKLIFRPVLKAIQYLHDRHIVHRNIRPQNIYVDLHIVEHTHTACIRQVKLSGFEYAALSLKDDLSQCVGLPEEMPPEMHKDTSERYGKKTDIWSVGNTLYKVLHDSISNTDPGQSQSQTRNIWMQKPAYPGQIKRTNVSEEARRFIHNCCLPLPTQRPTANELLNYRWFFSSPTFYPAGLQAPNLHRPQKR